MLQRIWWLWPKDSPYRERENREWNQERENRFSLGRNAKGKRVEGIATFKKIVKEERVKGCHFREDSWEGESKVLLPLKEIISVWERVKKNKRNFSLAVRHTQEKLFGVCPVVFFFQEKGFST